MTLVLQGRTPEDDVRSGSPPGTAQTATFELPPRHYAFICNLVEEEEGQTEAHYASGMWVDVEVS